MDNPIILEKSQFAYTLTFNRISQRNTLNVEFLVLLNELLDKAEADRNCRFFILQGQKGIFCTGMEFEEISSVSSEESISMNDEDSYFMNTLKRLSLSSKVVISNVDGKVLAGGVGLVSASDIVISTPRSDFGLSEAIWGLLPACVTPYLIRRIGFQKAFSMTLTTQPIDAEEAKRIGLVDFLSEQPDLEIRRLLLRVGKLDETTIKNMKLYFRKMWIISDEMENKAVREFTKLKSSAVVKKNINNYALHKKLPWEE